MGHQERHYPEITAAMTWPFKLVIEHMKEDPTYLNGLECPYSGEVKAFLASLLSRTPVGQSTAADAAAAMENGDVDQEGLEANIKRVFRELTEYGKKLGAGDTAEQSAYFRLSTTLLDKLVTLEERARGVRHQQEFEEMILEFLEDHCTPDVRTQLMDKLRELT